MIKITMFSSADKVKGQGVGSAYLELMQLLKTRASDRLDIKINRFKPTTISHYHTIDPHYFITTFLERDSVEELVTFILYQIL